jgi:uracil-DNA glycosylase family protein
MPADDGLSPPRRLAAREALAALQAPGKATDACSECPIGQYATQSVFGEGPARALLMMVGEQPGDKEDLAGRPFVGPAGKLLDRAVAQLGWDREKLYVTNAVKHFKYEWRGKRRMHKTPAQREAEACHHWLESELRLVQPRAIIALGATAARSLLGHPVAVTKLRGQWMEDPAGRRVLVTLHPSALLRGDPAQREAAWEAWLKDLSVAAEVFEKAPGRPQAPRKPSTRAHSLPGSRARTASAA